MLSHPLRAAAGQRRTLYQIISGLGLTTNLKLCLDAGDAASYDPAVQTAKWLDTSGGGYDFYRGSSGSGDAGEPTFNGTAGQLSINEYWSFDGGDFFTYDSAIETWMKDMAANNGLWSAVFMLYLSDTSTAQMILTTSNGSALNATGLQFRYRSTNTDLTIRYANGTSAAVENSGATISQNTWTFAGWGWDEGGNYQQRINDSTASANGDSIYANTTAAGPMTIGYLNSYGDYLSSGARIACIALWQGTALTAQNLTDIYNALKGRFGK